MIFNIFWERYEQPILSTLCTGQSWCKVALYAPTVLYHKGKYRMWYVGTSTDTRSGDNALGYAESLDGLVWSEYEKNPIARPGDFPFGNGIGTPCVIFDEEAGIFKLWFVSPSITKDERGQVVTMTQQLGYGESEDGIKWKIRPEPFYDSGRAPCVRKNADGSFGMWMNSRPSLKHDPFDLYKNIYYFTSPDGIKWKRSSSPALQPTGKLTTALYPDVARVDNRFIMLFVANTSKEGNIYQVYAATSQDGQQWTISEEEPFLPIRRDKELFDSRYTSTPRFLDCGDHYKLYYSSRDRGNLYCDGQGKLRTDNSGIYRHIGVATAPKPSFIDT